MLCLLRQSVSNRSSVTSCSCTEKLLRRATNESRRVVNHPPGGVFAIHFRCRSSHDSFTARAMHRDDEPDGDDDFVR